MLDGIKMTKILLKDIVINSAQLGEGELVLLVHGWPEIWYSWRHQIKPIADLGFKVIAIDMRGYGESSKPLEVEKYDMKSLMQDIIDIIDHQKRKSAILIGHDWGAPICWNTAAIYPERISAVMGLSVPFSKRGEISNIELWKKLYENKFFYQIYFQKEGIAEKEFEKDIPLSLRKIYYSISAEGINANIKPGIGQKIGFLEGIPDPNPFPKWLNQVDLKYYSAAFKKSGFRGPLNRYRNQERDWNMLPELSYLMVTQPSFFIGGEKDPVRYFIKNKDGYENPGKYCQNFLGKNIINNAGHWVQQESPKEVTNCILDFLKQL